MGYYIDSFPNGESLGHNKAESLLSIEGTEEINEPNEWVENLVCVVYNQIPGFYAAGYCFSPNEFEAFAYPCGRPKRWFIVPNAAKLSGYKKSFA